MINRARQRKTRLGATCVLLSGMILVGLGALFAPSDVSATPPALSEAAAASAAPDAGSTATVAAPSVEATTATIVFATTPPATATVVWGRKRLGKITPGKPLVVVRPRDSGPLDVMVRAVGFLAVQTRAHTFSDNRVVVKLTLPENKSELFGYRAPLDAGVEPEPAEAQDAVTPGAGTPQDQGTMFRVVPATPAPSPWLLPP